MVVAVLFLFLGNLRAALIVAAAIPLSMLFAFCGMLRFGIAASLLSLGAIDFGMIVDSSVVMIENCVRKLSQESGSGRSRLEIIRDAAVEVRKPTIFGELIIMIVYLPILTLEGVEGKMFRPMALTVIFALLGLDDPVDHADARARKPVASQARGDSRALAHALGPRDPFSRSAVRHAAQAGRHRPGRRPPFRRLWNDRTQPRFGIRAAAFGRGRRHQRRAAGRDRSCRIGTLQHRDGESDPPNVSRRGGARLEPHRHGGDRHRSDGRRIDRHLCDA